MLDKIALGALVALGVVMFGLFVAYSASREATIAVGRRAAAYLRGACVNLSNFVDAMGAARRAAWAAIRPRLSAAFSRLIPYARSRTNIVQALQFAGIAFAAPMSAAQAETWAMRVWLLVSALLFVAGILYRGPKSGPAMGPGAAAELGAKADTPVSGFAAFGDDALKSLVRDARAELRNRAAPA